MERVKGAIRKQSVAVGEKEEETRRRKSPILVYVYKIEKSGCSTGGAAAETI